MCTKLIRSMSKTAVLRTIAIWEMVYFSLIAIWAAVWWWKLDKPNEYDVVKANMPVETKNIKTKVDAEYQIALKQWDLGLYLHTFVSVVYVPASVLLFWGLRRKSRCLIIIWIMITFSMAMIRTLLLVILSHAFRFLEYLEFYWIARLYFIFIAAHYCLELWSAQVDSERLDPPILLPLEYDDDYREWKGELNYPAYPYSLDPHPSIGHSPKHDLTAGPEKKYKIYPLSYVAQTEDGQSSKVFDNPPYENI